MILPVYAHRSPAFEKQLRWCMRHGNLRVADLARWLGRPDGTVRGWVQQRLHPGGSELDVEHVYKLLELLETMIKNKQGFPLRVGLRPSTRKKKLLELRAKVFSETGAAS